MTKKKIKISKKSKSWQEWFSWGKRKETRAERQEKREQFIRRIKIAAISIFLPLLPSGLVVGFFYMEKYVLAQEQINPTLGSLMFVDAPDWVYSEAMKKKLAAAAGGGHFQLRDGIAAEVGEKLSKLSWLYDIRVQTTTQNIKVHAHYREPQAVIHTAKGKLCYVGLPAKNDPLAGENPEEANTVFVLDYVDIKKPPLIEIVGFADKSAPAPDKTWYASDVTAALKLISAMKAMDKKECKEKPLTEEIASIDVSNYNGRNGPTAPHIILNLKDGKTLVNWGAAIGQSTRFLEASDIEKLTSLYSFYREHKFTLQNIATYIELRYPKSIPRPQ